MSAPIKKLWKKWVAQCVKISFLIPLVDSLTFFRHLYLAVSFMGDFALWRFCHNIKRQGSNAVRFQNIIYPFIHISITSYVNFSIIMHEKSTSKPTDLYQWLLSVSLKFYWASWVLSSGQADRLASPRTAAEPVGLHLRYQELVTLK